MAESFIHDKFSRRTFLKWSSVAVGAAAVVGTAESKYNPFVPAVANGAEPEQVIPTGCTNNCGGRCVHMAHVQNGKMVRITTDVSPDDPDAPQLRACLRGRSFRQIVYHPDRLKYPMKRVGARGEGKWQRISWEEATTMVADQVKRVTEKYGPLSVYVNYAWGMSGINSGTLWARKMLGEYSGDWLNYLRDYSACQTEYATPITFGTAVTMDFRENWVNSKLIILDGFNPAEMIWGTNTMYYLKKAKAAGARIVAIDPRYTDTAVALADEWIPIKPSTDAALFSAMAYVIITEGLYDQDFLNKVALGFDENHMPTDVKWGQSYKTYILGQGDDKTPKTPQWAEAITGIPAAKIVELARQYATMKPANLIQGYGPQRHANGEQQARAATVLTVLTGNIGIKGGSGSGCGASKEYPVTGYPAAKGGKVGVPCFLWTDAITRGKEMTAKTDGIEGADKLPSNIKLIFNLAGNCLVNQHADINKTVKILKDESLCEFIVTSDIFMTPSAQYSDLVLPATTQYERTDLITPWGYGEYLIWLNQAIEPQFEARNEYDWLADVAAKLGVKDKYTEGRSLAEWMDWCLNDTEKAYPDFNRAELKKTGLYRVKRTDFTPPFAENVADPVAHPFPTKSGKVEFFSPQLWERNQLDEVPAIPKYVPAAEGPDGELRAKYPLQCQGWHYKRRAHSIHDTNPWMEEVARQEMWMNPEDADARGIQNGDKVKVFNDRGAMHIPVRVTKRIVPGVVAVPQGAWYNPGPDGVDERGAINILTSQKPSPMSWGDPMHTNLVQVEKA